MNRTAAILATAILVAAAALPAACGGNATTGGDGGSGTGTSTGTPAGTSTGTTTTGTTTGTPSGTPSGTSTVESHDFNVTIDNQSNAAVFVDGLGLPFTLFQGADGLRLWAFCDCDRCGTGDSCPHGDPVPMAVELPAGDSMLVEVSLNWYSGEDITSVDCPEAEFYGQCDRRHAFAPGTYEISVRHDDLAAMTAQGLEATPNSQWGHTVWMGQGIGTAILSDEQRQTFELSGDATTLTVTITD